MQFLRDILNKKEINNWWSEYGEFCKNFKKIDLDLYIKVLPEILEKLRNSYGINDLQKAINRESKNDTEFGKQLYFKTLRSEIHDSYFTLIDILSGIYQTDEKFVLENIKALIKNEDIELISIGIRSLIALDFSGLSTSLKEWIKQEIEEIINERNEVQLWVSILFVARVKYKESDILNFAIEKLHVKADDNIKIELIRFVFYNLNLEKDNRTIKKYLPSLLSINIQNSGVYNQLSFGLSDLVQHDKNTVIEFITTWVNSDIQNAKKIKYFSYALNRLFDICYKDFQYLFTDWLNKDNSNFHIAIFEMNKIGDFRELSKLEVSESYIKNLSFKDIQYIIYKILGYIYDKDTSLSLIFSILKFKKDERKVVNLISELFLEYFIFNYYSVIEFLKEKNQLENNPLNDILSEIIKEGEKKYEPYSKLNYLKEFKASERRLNYYYLVDNRKLTKSYEGSKLNSPLDNITKTSYYRTGKTVFHKYRGEYTDKLEPSLLSNSFELPRGEFIDPTEQQKNRLYWQNHKRQ